MKNIAKCALLISGLLLSACAKSPDNIVASSVSPVLYQNLDCNSLNVEAHRINDRLNQLTGRQREAATQDSTLTAVSLILFWPAAFFIGNEDHEAEISRLRGEAEAVSYAALSKNCQTRPRMVLGAPAISPFSQ